MTSKKILIADDDSALVDVLVLRCKLLGLEVITAHTARAALNLVSEFHPDLICMDLHMPSGTGLGVCEMLANDAQSASTPVIIMTGCGDEEIVRRCHSLCAFYVEKCGDLWSRLEPLVCELLQLEPSRYASAAPAIATQASTASSSAEHNPLAAIEIDRLRAPHFELGETASAIDDGECQLVDTVFALLGATPGMFDTEDEKDSSSSAPDPPWVLCIDDDADYSMALKLRLEAYGIAVIRAFEGMEGFRSAFTRPADVILLDYELPNGRGDYILRRLKSNPVTKDLPVIVITGQKDRSLERRMIDLGAARFMTKPPDFMTLLEELRRHIDVLPQPSKSL